VGVLHQDCQRPSPQIWKVRIMVVLVMVIL
jgi:hypothetical protein